MNHEEYYVAYTMDLKVNWAGPFVTVYEARRERDAWKASGEQARVVHSTIEIRAKVRAWLEGRGSDYGDVDENGDIHYLGGTLVPGEDF